MQSSAAPRLSDLQLLNSCYTDYSLSLRENKRRTSINHTADHSPRNHQRDKGRLGPGVHCALRSLPIRRLVYFYFFFINFATALFIKQLSVRQWRRPAQAGDVIAIGAGSALYNEPIGGRRRSGYLRCCYATVRSQTTLRADQLVEHVSYHILTHSTHSPHVVKYFKLLQQLYLLAAVALRHRHRFLSFFHETDCSSSAHYMWCNWLQVSVSARRLLRPRERLIMSKTIEGFVQFSTCASATCCFKFFFLLNLFYLVFEDQGFPHNQNHHMCPRLRSQIHPTARLFSSRLTSLCFKRLLFSHFHKRAPLVALTKQKGEKKIQLWAESVAFWVSQKKNKLKNISCSCVMTKICVNSQEHLCLLKRLCFVLCFSD